MSIATQKIFVYGNPINDNEVTNKKYVDDLVNNVSPDIYKKIKKACKTIQVSQIIKNPDFDPNTVDSKEFITTISTGSGSFISLNESDLKEGLFLTAAHCVYPNVDTICITNPITNNWHIISVNYSNYIGNVFYDGIGDIAIVKTGFDLSNNPDCYLKLSNEIQNIGDFCYMCGNPLGIDAGSFANGVIRDNHHMMSSGHQAVDTLLVSIPSFQGNSGSPILNLKGDIIGLLTYSNVVSIQQNGATIGTTSAVSLSGGANLDTLKKSLSILKMFKVNKEKKYLGLNWRIPNCFELKDMWKTDVFKNQGAFISVVTPDKSPFYGKLGEGDILLSASYGNNVINFGTSESQRTPGVLIYEYNVNSILIEYLDAKDKGKVKTQIVHLNKTYSNLPDDYDMFLSGTYKI